MDSLNEISGGDGWSRAYEAHSASNADSTFLWDQRPHPYLEEIDLVRRLRCRRASLVMDAGCGDGRNSFHLAGCGFFVLGVDISEVGLNLARSRALRDGHANVVFSRDDITHMHTTGPVDVILCADALGQVEAPQLALSEFYRILRPGGVLIANLYDRHDDTFGQGAPHETFPDSFVYKGTLFRFFSEDSFLSLFTDPWVNVSIRKSIWFDPAHGTFRPTPHKHSSLVAWAEKPMEVCDE